MVKFVTCERNHDSLNLLVKFLNIYFMQIQVQQKGTFIESQGTGKAVFSVYHGIKDTPGEPTNFLLLVH